MSYIFTSESVSEGHPDKLCDRVSDTVLDLFLKHEPEARVACETLATTNLVCLLYTSPSPRDRSLSRMPSSA